MSASAPQLLKSLVHILAASFRSAEFRKRLEVMHLCRRPCRLWHSNFAGASPCPAVSNVRGDEVEPSLWPWYPLKGLRAYKYPQVARSTVKSHLFLHKQFSTLQFDISMAGAVAAVVNLAPEVAKIFGAKNGGTAVDTIVSPFDIL